MELHRNLKHCDFGSVFPVFYLKHVKTCGRIMRSPTFKVAPKPMLEPRNDFHCITTWVVCSSGRNSAAHLLVLWFRVYEPDSAIIQYKYLKRVYFD